MKKFVRYDICFLLLIFLVGCIGLAALSVGSKDYLTANSSQAPTPPVTENLPSLEPAKTVTDAIPSGPADIETAPPSSVYTELSDEQFALLTEEIAKSFYSFSLPEEEYQVLQDAPTVMDCLTKIYDYAYNNYFEIDPAYKSAFADKYDVVSAIPNYDQLMENFVIEHYRDSASNRWVYEINSYSLNPSDVVQDDGIIYIDAEGYLKEGVTVYWEEDDKIVEVGEIEDIAYNKEINGVILPYALNVTFFGDPDSSGWRDGESFLTFNKKLVGKPAYFVSALDGNRSVKKEIIDYSGSIQWRVLDEGNAKSGTTVYYGATTVKAPMFMIKEVDPRNDVMIVEYPSGSVENKSYSAMLNNSYLYVR